VSESASQGDLLPGASEGSWFAVAAPGLEEIVAAEVRRLPGATAVKVVPGGVDFAGDLEVGMRANLWLRATTRVLLRVGTVRAREFALLRKQMGKLPWERWVAAGDPLRVSASASGSRLYHTGALAEALVLAIGDRLQACGRAVPQLAPKLVPGARGQSRTDDAPDEGTDAGEPALASETRILLRGISDRWTVSVDSSGELLHRRGWRTEGGRAPLRETLAAALLSLAGYDPSRPLLDPMCGSGTIVLEAASLAAGRPPGGGRSFAFQRWPGFDQARWQALLGEIGGGPSAGGPIFGWDRDAAAVARARRNADRAGLADRIELGGARFGAGGGAVEPAAALAALVERTGGRAGLVLINPPYGRRLGHVAAASRLVKDIGRTLRAHFPGWRAGVLLGDARWAAALGLTISSRTVVPNGGLRLTLAVAEIPVQGVRAKQ
jgi:putative N6-adenine-specific DNA methylase